MSRRKFREERSKFYGTKQVLQDLNSPAHLAVHDLDPIVSGLPRGGFTGQVLVKLSNDDFDVGWADAIDTAPADIDGGPSDAVHTTFYDGGDASGSALLDTLDGGDATS